MSRMPVSLSVSVFGSVGWSEGSVFGRRADWKTFRRICWRGSGIVLFVSRNVLGVGSFLPLGGGFLEGFLLLDGGFLLFDRGGMVVGCLIDIKKLRFARVEVFIISPRAIINITLRSPRSAKRVVNLQCVSTIAQVALLPPHEEGPVGQSRDLVS